MTTIPAGSIVVGADGSRDADRAVHWAAEQAALERRPLVMLSVASETPALVAAGPGAAYAYPAEGLIDGALAVAREAAVLAVRHRPGITVESVAVLGNARSALTDLTSDTHLLVLGSRGRGPLRTKLLGSVSTSVTRNATCPVVVCRPGTDLRVKKGVLVGADGTAESLPVIDFAFRQASLRSQPLTIVHTVHDVVAAVVPAHLASDTEPELASQRLLLAETLAGFGERYPEVRVSTHVARGFAEEALAAIADAHNLVVIGRHPMDSIARRLSGAVATAVLERSHTHIAVVPEAAPGTPTH